MKDLESRFAEIEKRVRALAAEKKALAGRVRELEQELVLARREALEMQHFRSKRMHIREKVERILNALEVAEKKE